MADNSSNGFSDKSQATAAGPAPRRRSSLPLAIVAALLVIVPFLTWYGTWFGRELTDEQIGEYLSDESHPRKVQHALSQLAERMDKRDERARQFYPQLLKLAGSALMEFRLTVAWLMGKDNRAQEFHTALVRLLDDSEPIVRRNAALSLLTFGDTSGKREVRAMLQPYTVNSTAEGTIMSALPVGSQVAVGSLLGRLKEANGRMLEVRAPLPGKISSLLMSEGAQVKTGDPLCLLAPDEASVWEALRALYLIGEREDLPLVERYSKGVEGMSERVKEQAALTLKAIQGRSENSRSAGVANQP
ncbi:MAG TPA: biotin/lipoyl-binding protein [Pyrinomonadaceae bacterium]|jgi:hypothetical protein